VYAVIGGRRVLACLLALLVLGEVSGVARAFGPGATVHCCCGGHASARPCPCPDCPAAVVRAPRAHGAPAQARLDGRNCDGSSTTDDPGVLRVLAALPALSELSPAPVRGVVDFVPPVALSDRSPDPSRPPP
jgi:hypothetical protein